MKSIVVKAPDGGRPKLDLPGNEIHIWRIDANSPQLHEESLLEILAQDEREKADRYYFYKDRRDSIISRAALRDILSCYLALSPIDLHFSYGPYGKPSLATRSEEVGLEFNLSHSQGLILIAVAANRPVGIDVERIRLDSDWENIVERFFSGNEVAALRRLPKKIRTQAFFHCWTQKEAYIKAKGGGLSIDLAAFDVSMNPEEPACLLRSQEDPEAPNQWTLRKIDLSPRYAATVAVKGDGGEFRFSAWIGRSSSYSLMREIP